MTDICEYCKHKEEKLFIVLVKRKFYGYEEILLCGQCARRCDVYIHASDVDDLKYIPCVW